MRITLYSFPDCIHAKAFRIFLEKNNLPHAEIAINSKNMSELRKLSFMNRINVSILKVIKNHGPEVCVGFDEQQLNLNTIEHIKKYNPKVTL